MDEQQQAQQAQDPVSPVTLHENVLILISHSLNALGQLKPSREASITRTKLEEAFMWCREIRLPEEKPVEQSPIIT